MTTSVPKPAEQTEQWFIYDARGQVLGRLATDIAVRLRGKNLPTFAPHVPTRTHVIVLNAATIKVTGQKLEQKRYYRHSGRPGSLQSRTLAEQMARDPRKVIERAVYGMLPDNRLRQVWMRQLHVYADDQHPHTAKAQEVTNG